MLQHPGVLVKAADADASVLYAVAVPPGAVMVHTLLNPVTSGTVGSVKAALQVLGIVMSANGGKTTAFVLTGSHAAMADTAFIAVFPHAAAS